MNIALTDLSIDQQPGKDIVSYKHIELSIATFTGNLQRKALKYIHVKDITLAVDSLHVQQTPDTTIFQSADFSMGFKKLDIQTADSIFHLMIAAFALSKKEKSINLSGISFKPNMSDLALQKRSEFQKAQFAGTIGSIKLQGINFNSLIYRGQIAIDEIFIDSVSAFIFKDKRKPVNKQRFPKYVAQNVKAIPVPLSIGQITATRVNLFSTEIKPAGDYGKANISRGTLVANNITNQPTNKILAIKADAFIEQVAHAHLSIKASYNVPEIWFNGHIEKFDLTGLNNLIQSFTPASIKNGIIDDITFSGNASGTSADGTMKFLYHDLEVDLQLANKAKWKSSVLAFAANTYLRSANPPANLPPRIVQYHAERDRNKGFINLLIKSVLTGLKETLILTKENKKEYRALKKEEKKEARKARKEAKGERKKQKGD